MNNSLPPIPLFAAVVALAIMLSLTGCMLPLLGPKEYRVTCVETIPDRCYVNIAKKEDPCACAGVACFPATNAPDGAKKRQQEVNKQ